MAGEEIQFRPASCVACRRPLGTGLGVASHLLREHGQREQTVAGATAIDRWFTLSAEELAEIDRAVAARRAAR